MIIFDISQSGWLCAVRLQWRVESGTAGNIILQIVAADFGGSGRRNAAVVAAAAATAMEAVVARDRRV